MEARNRRIFPFCVFLFLLSLAIGYWDAASAQRGAAINRGIDPNAAYKARNLSDLTDPAAAVSNLGLPSAATVTAHIASTTGVHGLAAGESVVGSSGAQVSTDTFRSNLGIANHNKVVVDSAGNAAFETTDVTATRGINLSQYNTGAHGALFVGQKARGTPSIPLTVVNGDYLAIYSANGYDGTSFINPAYFGFRADGPIGAGSIPTEFFVKTGYSGGGNDVLRISSSGDASFSAGLAFNAGADTVASTALVTAHTNATTNIHGSGANTRFLTASETILDAQIPVAIARDIELPGVGSFSFQDLSAGTVPIASGGTGQIASSAALTAFGGAHLGQLNVFTNNQEVRFGGDVTLKVASGVVGFGRDDPQYLIDALATDNTIIARHTNTGYGASDQLIGNGHARHLLSDTSQASGSRSWIAGTVDGVYGVATAANDFSTIYDFIFQADRQGNFNAKSFLASDPETTRDNFGLPDNIEEMTSAASTTLVTGHTNAATNIHGSGANTRFLTASETISDSQIPATIARDIELPGVGSFSFQDLSAGTVPIASGGTGAITAPKARSNLSIRDDSTLVGLPIGLQESVGAVWITATSTTETTIHAFTYCGNGVILAGTAANGRIYRSTDFGANWTLATDTAESNIYSLTYCGRGIVIAGAGPSGLIYRSTDTGQTWAEVLDSSETDIYSLAYCGNGVVLAGAGGSGIIYRSSDYGATWGTASDTPDSFVFALTYCGNDVALAGGGNTGTIYRSSDAGVTWAIASDTAELQILSLTYCGNDVALAGSGNSGLIYRSVDSGTTWTIATNTPETAIFALAYCGNGVALAGAGITGIMYRSLDYGATWNQILDTSETSLYAIQHCEKGIVVAGSFGSGLIYRSTDFSTDQITALSNGGTGGTTAEEARDNFGLPDNIEQMTSAASTSAIPGVGSFSFQDLSAGTVPIASGGTGQIASSAALTALGGLDDWTDNIGWSWEQIWCTTGNPYILSMAGIGDTIIAGTGDTSARVYISRNRGRTWGDSQNFAGGVMVRDMAAGSSGTVVLCTSNDGAIWWADPPYTAWTMASDTTNFSVDGSLVYVGSATWLAGGDVNKNIIRSVDGGRTWAIATDTAGAATPKDFLAAASNASGTAYFGATGGPFNTQCYKTTDFGVTWTFSQTTIGNVPRCGIVTKAGSVLFGTVTTGKIHRSTDSGATFAEAYDSAATVIYEIIEVKTGVLLAFGDTGVVYRSGDDGATWATAGTTSLPLSNACAVNAGGGIILVGAGLNGATIYRQDLLGVNP